MARSALTDVLQCFPFWLVDVAPIEPLSFPVFTPLLGFSAISAPEITMEVEEINEGNWYFARKVIKRGSIKNIVLSRGATFYDADFYRWITAAITGTTGGTGSLGALALGGPTPRRDLLLIHAFARTPFGSPAEASAVISAGLAMAAGGSIAFGGAAGGSELALSAGVLRAGISGGLAPGPFQMVARIPARAFLLHGCLPVRYLSGTDFDAKSGEVSVRELELVVEAFDELNLAG